MKTGRTAAALAAWWSYVVVDFLAHGVFLASWWRATQEYWLPPAELFRRIPFGYASFGIYCATLTWILARLHGERPSILTGLRVGAIAGGIFGVVAVLAMYSALRVPASFLLVGPASAAAESSVAGAAGAWVLSAERQWRRAALVIGVGGLLLAAGIVIQNVWIPTPADRMLSRP